MWYTAVLLFFSKSTPPLNEELWEERILLIEAESDAQAEQRAQLFGKRREHHYIAMEGNKIEWEFKEVIRIYSLDYDTPKDGAEVLCRYLSGACVAAMKSGPT